MGRISFVFLFFCFVSNAHSKTDRSYVEVQAFLMNLEKTYPKSAEVFTMALSDSGDPIQGVKLGSGQTPHLVVGTHHGNEYGSTEVALAFAESVAKDPIPDQTLYVIPVLNIPGYNTRNRYEKVGEEEEANYFDANRDYPSPCDTEGPFHLKSTRALAEFIADKKIVGSATLHTYTGAVLYPWGISTHDVKTEYDEFFIQLTRIATAHSGYLYGNASDLIYPADGTFEDYAFMEHGVWSVLFELGYSHMPTDAEIQSMIDTNVPGLRDMFLAMPTERAERHAFTGVCDLTMRRRDRHDE